jgi:putative Mn2+ efflux pump MntP
VPAVEFLSVLLIALSLAADCFAVALGGSLSPEARSPKLVARVAVSFGVFQAGMTWAGWLAGSVAVSYIASYDHWLAFALLAFIGGKMIRESRRPGSGGIRITAWGTLLVLSLATSLDALAVGLSLAFLRANIVLAGLAIGLVALAVTALGFVLGRRLGALAGKRSETIGGAVLIVIGVWILLEHLL